MPNTNTNTNKLTGYNVTADQINALRDEAIEADDHDMVEICETALKQRRNGQWEAGDVAASQACADAINAGQG